VKDLQKIFPHGSKIISLASGIIEVSEIFVKALVKTVFTPVEFSIDKLLEQHARTQCDLDNSTVSYIGKNISLSNVSSEMISNKYINDSFVSRDEEDKFSIQEIDKTSEVYDYCLNNGKSRGAKFLDPVKAYAGSEKSYSLVNVADKLLEEFYQDIYFNGTAQKNTIETSIATAVTAFCQQFVQSDMFGEKECLYDIQRTFKGKQINVSHTLEDCHYKYGQESYVHREFDSIRYNLPEDYKGSEKDSCINKYVYADNPQIVSIYTNLDDYFGFSSEPGINYMTMLSFANYYLEHFGELSSLDQCEDMACAA
jgi:hypothetical protein